MIAAALQFFATPFALEHNQETAARLARAAANQGARLIVLPELFNTGYVYSPRLTASAETPNGPTVNWLQAMSCDLGVWLGGTLLLRSAGDVFNTFVLAGPNGQLFRYAKRHPFLWESCYFAPGREPVIAETDFGRLGLMVCWDFTHRIAWADYAGRVDAVLLASSPARVHRAVFNFPRGRKVYAAQLMPALLKRRDALDELYGNYVGQCAAALGVPVVHSVMAGRFVAQLPLARLSFISLAAFRPRFWSWAAQASQATLRATFYGTTAIYNAQGQPTARVEADEGMALAELNFTQPTPVPGPVPVPNLPSTLRIFETLLGPLAKREYRKHVGV